MNAEEIKEFKKTYLCPKCKNYEDGKCEIDKLTWGLKEEEST